jgi:hypothetical protein
MINWQETAPDTYRATVGETDIVISPTAYATWTWLLSKDGRAVKGGNCRALEEAQERAVKAVEV